MSRLIFRLIAAVVLCCGAVLPCVAQNPAAPVQTLLILPFENHSKSPGLEWIGESFPEILAQRLSSPSMYIISREDRVYAFDRMGIPVSARPSHATLYRIAEQMDCDYVVMGDYNFDGVTFTARATVLDMKQLRQSPALEASGPLLNLIDVQTDLAWQLLKSIQPREHDQPRRDDPLGQRGAPGFLRKLCARHCGHHPAGKSQAIPRG